MLAYKSMRTSLQRCASAVRAFSNVQFGYDVIGIDLGVANTRLAAMEAKGPTILESESGRATPSVVAVAREKKILVGEMAKYYAVAYPEDVIFNMNALIGRRFDDPQVQKLRTTVPYKIIENSDGAAWIEACNEKLSPTQICAYILSKMKESAEACLNRGVSKAVIATPVDFDDTQREQLELAAKSAGLEVLGFVDKPIAVALACKSIQDGTIVVIDMGGWTFDVSILEISSETIKVKATDGNTSLGGEDFDGVLLNYLVEEIKMGHAVDVSGDRIAMMRLKEAAETAKIELSSSLQALIHVPHLTISEVGIVHANITISRSTFEELVECLVGKVKEHCEDCLKGAGISVEKVDEVLFVGGMSRVPLLQQVIREIFRRSPSIGGNAVDAVSTGAALQGALITENRMMLLPIMIPLSLGIETLGGSFTRIIHRQNKFPIMASRSVSTLCDSQESALVRILQGEQEIASGNKLLGELKLTGILPLQQGDPHIKLTFDVAVDGSLTVTATNEDTGKVQSMKVESVVDMNEDDVRMIVKEAILRRQRNMEKSVLSQTKCKAELAINRIDNLQKKRYVLPRQRLDAQRMLNDLRTAIGSENVLLIQSKIYEASYVEAQLLADQKYDSSDENEL